MKVAGYTNDDIECMSDVSAFRRFFVITNLLREILGGMFSGMMGGDSNESTGGGTGYTPNGSERYGADPFASPTMNTEPPTREEMNDIHNFPS